VAIAIVLALLAGWFAVPRVIESAYRGESLSILNDMIVGRGVHTSDHYLGLWRQIYVGIVVSAAVILAIISSLALFLGPVRRRLQNDPLHLDAVRGEVLWGVSTGLIATGAVILILYGTPLFIRAAREDSIIEWAAFATAGIAAVLLAFTMAVSPARRTLGMLVLTLGALFLCLEEVSWGQRVLNISTPGFVLDANLQKEINIHNLFNMDLYHHAIVGLALICWAIVPIVFKRRSLPVPRVWRSLGIPTVPAALVPMVVIAGTVLLLSPIRTLYRIEELGELMLCSVFLFLATYLAWDSASAEHVRSDVPAGQNALTLGILAWSAAITSSLVLFAGPRPGPLLSTTAVHDMPSWALRGQAMQVLEYLDRDPDLTEPATLIEGGALLYTLGEPEQARSWLQRGLEELPPRNETSIDPPVERYRIMAYQNLGQAVEAEEVAWLTVAADSARLRAAGSRSQAGAALFSIAQTLALAGEPELAFDHAEEACRHWDSRHRRRRVQFWLEGTLSRRSSDCEF
jgi:hypothetical protein